MSKRCESPARLTSDLSKKEHPTSRNGIASPSVLMSLSYRGFEQYPPASPIESYTRACSRRKSYRPNAPS